MDSEVQVVESCLVVPSEGTPRKRLWLSPMDLMLTNRGHTPTIYFYRSSGDGAKEFFDVARLKEAMAKALVAFYPLAGRIEADDDGRCKINCNGEGALFFVARSQLTVNDFKDLKPSPELRRMFVPPIEPSSIVLAIQVTFMRCGGVALGTALHHFAIDGTSAFHFFQTWSAFCRDGDNNATVEAPFHDRTLLRARSPPVVHPDALSLFCPRPRFCEPSGPMSCESFSISKDQLAALKRLCGGGGASTFCAVSALVWRCAIAARRRRLPPDAEARLLFPANVRRVLNPPLQDRYFGNAVIFLLAAGAARDIASEEPLGSVAGRIGGAVGRMDDALVRSAIDCLELDEAESRTVRRDGTVDPDTDLVMVSWLGMPAYDIDFGWGKPLAMSRAESVRGGFVYLMNGAPAEEEEDGSGCAVRVLTCMEAANVKEFERVLYEQLK